jgi:CubicO group peptidase (beta-lactamase class C family)
MKRQIAATLSILMTVTAGATAAQAEEFLDDERAVTSAARMLDTLGCRAAWARARTIRTELQGHHSRGQEPWDETFWMDLEAPRGRFDRIEQSVHGFFETGSYPSLIVGVVRGDALVYEQALGIADKRSGRAATTETIYDIGSVGKVLTTAVLAVLDDRGVVHIDDPVDRWLPKGVEVPTHPSGGPPMTLEHLATHTSGLPGRPLNVSHLPEWQWPDYSAERLFQGLAQTKLLYPPGTDLAYSSLGTGLLGHVMARAAATPYEHLVEEELLGPLGMTDTVVRLSDDQRTRYAVGYETADSTDEAPHWEYGVLAGCGSHRSTVRDLARFISALWNDRSTTAGRLSATARTELLRPRWRSQDGKDEVALGWFVTRRADVGVMLGHRGRTAGHGAFVGIIPDRATGVIVLANLGGREANIRLAEFGQRLLTEVVLPIGE